MKGRSGRTGGGGLLDQPRGLAVLFFTEAWERFSYYGMKAILLFYLYDRVRDGGLGMEPASAASLIAVYGACVYLAAIGGGWVSDRLLGPRRATAYGGVAIMVGHVCLALPAGRNALYASMVFIVIGTGLLKPTVTTSVGALYAPDDVRRDAGFSLYYMGISVGAVLAPLVVGTLGQHYDYHLGFGAAAVGMAAGLVVYSLGRRHLAGSDLRPGNPLHRSEVRPRPLSAALGAALFLGVAAVLLDRAGLLTADLVVDAISALAVLLPAAYFTTMLRSRRTSPAERSAVRAYIPLFVAAVFFWLVQEQGASVLAQYADRSTDLDALGFPLPSSWFQSTGSFVLICLTPFFAAAWMRLGSRQPAPATKFGLGLTFAGASYALLVIPSLGGGRSSPLWLFGSFALVTVGEILLSPVGLSLTTRVAPAAFVTRTTGLWLASNAAGQGVSAQIVRFYDRAHAPAYFGVVGCACLLVGVAVLLAGPALTRRMAAATADRAEEAAAASGGLDQVGPGPLPSPTSHGPEPADR
ncbi:peptide MFS transporter [Streptomyces sp. NPDC059740]|uniref:peptide MFS transporter n=1 Tax=Streptomyces sp. NPDC059740 TaxID=3346926 RepID=UPI00364F2EF0